jgi:spermidine synthase
MVQLVKWLLAAALILPQSVLLGMTFPLMTNGVLAHMPQRPGYVLAMLYFTNSLGAAAGVLASGFYFIGYVGLPGTLAAAAVINLAVAAAVVLVPRPPVVAPIGNGPGTLNGERNASQLLLAIAALTGLSSFMYEIGWIRMLSLVLGSSTHAFELMLSAFILGIALGGLWIRKRIDAASDAIRLLAFAQVAMGLAALSTLPVYATTFSVMQAALGALAQNEGGYVVFNVVSHAICLAVMFPAAFFAGMTLPLITASLLRRGSGPAAVGQVYAANTAGSILGVAIAVHVGLPLLGLKGLIVAAAAIDLALGVVLIRAAGSVHRRPMFAAAGVISIAAVAAALFLVHLNAHEMASGVYRLGRLLPETQTVFMQRDGKTATISVTGDDTGIALRTNGKSDGAIHVHGTVPVEDELTMTLMGALPQFMVPQARRAAVIGFGTGVTTHVLLAAPTLERVDTIEIEPAVLSAAVHFRPFNARALDDARSVVHFDDAKTYFSSHRGRYDIIASEPSNPWVSGVSGLFSAEFYRQVRRYLAPGGVFVQWVQLYELTPQLLASVVMALESGFTDYELWLPNTGDLIIVATHGNAVPEVNADALKSAALRADLERFRIRNLDDLRLHRVGRKATLGPYFASFGVQANSDFMPILDIHAPLARYMRAQVTSLMALRDSPARVLHLFEDKPEREADLARITPGDRPWMPQTQWITQAQAVRRFIALGNDDALKLLPVHLAPDLVALRARLVQCVPGLPSWSLRDQLADLSRFASVYLPRADSDAMWKALMPGCRAVSPAERHWLELYAALARSDLPELRRSSAILLEEADDLGGRLLAQALAAYMAARILHGEAALALAAYRKHRKALGELGDWEPVFRFLLSHAERRAG